MQFEEMLKKERMEGYDAGRKEGHEEGHKEGLEAGRREGQAEGSMQMCELITRMIADGKADMIPKLKTDEVFHKEMLKKYDL